jgi:hypothetical protein
MIDKCIAGNGAIHRQHATVNIGVASVGIGSREKERSRADLGQRPTKSAILDHAGKRSAKVVAAYGEIVCSQSNTGTFITCERADRYARSIMTPYVEHADKTKLRKSD